MSGPRRPTRQTALDLLGRRERGGNSFLRGLTIGVLVGAAIAGSRIWRRLARRGAV